MRRRFIQTTLKAFNREKNDSSSTPHGTTKTMNAIKKKEEEKNR
jgi:hypothetical protein